MNSALLEFPIYVFFLYTLLIIEFTQQPLFNVQCILFPSQAKLITPAHYKDAIEERSIVKLCGYPRCSNKLGNVRLLITQHICSNQK